jgi:hypothetical protein
MKAVIGVFEQKENIKMAVTQLKEAGFSEDDLALITSYQVEDVPDILGEEPEKTAVTGALVGSGIGGALGLLGSIVILPVIGIGALVASGLMATASGSILGGYLGSLYATRIEDEPEHELKVALAEGKVLLLAHVEESNEEMARTIMRQSGGSYLETQEISPEAISDMKS